MLSIGRLQQLPTRYAFAAAISLICLGLTLLLHHWTERSMFQLSVVAVVLSAWYGGLGPGLGRSITVSLGTFPACRADPTLLRVVFTNLLHNALKFTRAKGEGRIEVGCLTAGEPVYYVKDNGVGFDMQYAGQLFGIFQRLHREDAFEGTGVGLAIVQRIGHRHGGRIWAEARPGLGAAFYFTLGGKQA